jgi:amino acid transporter
LPTDVLFGGTFLGLMYLINYYGIAGGAKFSWILTAATILPLSIITIAPFFMGLINWANFQPWLPLNWEYYGQMVYCQTWLSWPAIYGIIGGGLFIAAWCDYAYEAVYTAEYRNPEKETYRAVLASTGLVGFFYVLLPVVSIGVLGLKGIATDPLVAVPRIGTLIMGAFGGRVMMVVMMAAILLALNQATNGGGRALYQMAEDGLLLKQFAAVNKHKVPSVAMAFDVVFNVFLMLLRNPIVILSASAVGYVFVNVLANRSISFMRNKFPSAPRPFKVPRWMWPLKASMDCQRIYLSRCTGLRRHTWRGSGSHCCLMHCSCVPV